MSLKVVIIGGGSSYTPEILEGLIERQPTLPVSEIVLVDVEAGKEKVATICQLGNRMIEEAGAAIELTWTLDRRSALKGADFVSTQIRVGGLAARAQDERIPLKHGMIGQETNGAGGIMKAFRTIPVLMEVAKEVQELCPDAWMINFTNPAGIVTEALLNHSAHKKVIGVCNIPFNMRHSTAELLQVPPEDVWIQFIGLNHFVFGDKVYVSGEDRTEDVFQKLLSKEFDYSPANIMPLDWSETFIQSARLLPNPYHQYYFQSEKVLEKDLKAYEENGTRAEVVQALEESLFDLYKQESLREKPKELEQRGGAFYSQVACSLMDSIYNNKEDIQTVNTWNHGTIPDLPYDAVIEANCVITKNGPKPIAIGEIPAPMRGMIQNMKAMEELVIKASMSGDYKDAYNAFLVNPLIQDEKKAKVVLDELLEAHEDYLPQFKR
ncbi:MULTISPECIES: 6-phospho-beta-glucosidase [Oceanobacillus]|uniref:6-phospho-beta-glucosidase n=2 Tax=Oceanobacillus TaxID=182709 RepID=A0ABV9JWZ4_9BACI|nr:6-phospho-beta-glucosidase [Oceanobacillus oncorhynchi]MDM8100033.1 6-phospho-beta-glucosidase [Oceanobacillus oncorhynchi]CEI82018.1 putative 6-phospho-beta-glucosidase [Oceanobacillus oncorhynchi]